MKAINIPKITGIVCTSIILNMINLSFALNNERTCRAEEPIHWPGIASNPSYKPVLDECPDLEPIEDRHDNLLYKKWCEETFINGNHIYEGYKKISFSIQYAPEAPETDNWQTPLETTRLEQGDCEDAVFLFFSHLPPSMRNAEIVWGWVIDRHRVAKAHVWYQLQDVEGKEYIVEGFTNDWNGIIPMDIMRETETRKPILKITHLEASRLSALITRPDSCDTYQKSADLHRPTDLIKIKCQKNTISEEPTTSYHLDINSIRIKSMSDKFRMSWNQPIISRIDTAVSKEISKIYKKLYELFTRYEKQINNNVDRQIAFSSTNHFRRSLNCRR